MMDTLLVGDSAYFGFAMPVFHFHVLLTFMCTHHFYYKYICKASIMQLNEFALCAVCKKQHQHVSDCMLQTCT